MWIKTTASILIRHFAEERRRVVSDWRILMGCRRIALASNAPLPDETKAMAVRRELQNRSDLVSVDGVGLSGIYLVNAPYASLLEVSEEQIIQEANPWAVFSHVTALAYHRLTDLIPSKVFATHFRGAFDRWVPLGTTPEDWAELDYPTPHLPRHVRKIEVSWSEVKSDWHFGIQIGYSMSSPIYVTDVERTLIDALRAPERSGGMSKVLHAWRRAEGANLDRLVDYTDRFDNQTLRQRVGFLLQTLDRPHPRLEQWRSRLLRGGSVRLVASEPYAETYSPEWNLSLNVPESVLAVLEED